MKTERQIAEQIFDSFRKAQCKAGHIVMMRNIQFGIIDKLNPKEKEIFHTVFNGLISTGYFTYEKESPESIRLTEKGYDYIYDEEKVKSMLKLPWVFPDIIKPDWDKAFNKLWKVIGPKETAQFYLTGGQFYKLIFELVDDLPPNNQKFIEARKNKNLSTHRADYYQDLVEHLDEEQRKTLYANIQISLESHIFTSNSQLESFDFKDPWEEGILPKESVAQKVEVEESQIVATSDESPIVFISYSWDTPEHEDWVLEMATKLRKNGVDVILDKWDLGPLGKPLPHFMENAVRKAKRVICVMTPNYKLKTDSLTGGVGYEYSIISAEIFSDIQTSKFIPLIRTGPNDKAIPSSLAGRKYIDMKDGVISNEKMEELLRDIYEEPKFKKPPLGQKPKFK
ncbi:toll/interleukin-1 receptor domain-containing protein [Belliella sp. R4-6]|uniref:Toll/interleukin-1 receptor domain-containing protein n=1 Tax=Belliella alkalica TaxID=1730871 RepID=A0ABS9VD12_9BACT|nr:toll/interleukin-1 receptor domain-containing protein [Belliella alkalica]MCH7414331.1 toll/interleukin-1 receptor domain-containing protein [Belliella alkalica]